MKKLMKGLLSMALMFSVVACSSADNLQLEVTEITVEYGDALSLEPKEYLAEDTSEDILNDTKVEVFVVEDDQKAEEALETDGSYLEVGNYILSLSYNDEVEDVNVTVEDTKAPEFVDFNETVTFVQGESTDLTQLFKTNDLSAVEVTVEGNVDFNTAGTYPIKVTAKDEYENTTEKDCSIVITAKEVAVNTPNTSGGSSSSSSSNNSSSGNNSSNTGSSNNTGSTGGSSNTGSSGSSSSGSSNTGSSSGGSTTPPSQPSQPEPTPEPHQHKFIVNDTTTYYEGNELLFDNWDDAIEKSTNIQYSLNGETSLKWGNWRNVSVFGVRCANGCGELWYAVELTY